MLWRRQHAVVSEIMNPGTLLLSLLLIIVCGCSERMESSSKSNLSELRRLAESGFSDADVFYAPPGQGDWSVMSRQDEVRQLASLIVQASLDEDFATEGSPVPFMGHYRVVYGGQTWTISLFEGGRAFLVNETIYSVDGDRGRDMQTSGS